LPQRESTLFLLFLSLQLEKSRHKLEGEHSFFLFLLLKLEKSQHKLEEEHFSFLFLLLKLEKSRHKLEGEHSFFLFLSQRWGGANSSPLPLTPDEEELRRLGKRLYFPDSKGKLALMGRTTLFLIFLLLYQTEKSLCVKENHTVLSGWKEELTLVGRILPISLTTEQTDEKS
jgi:hypothetical protein